MELSKCRSTEAMIKRHVEYYGEISSRSIIQTMGVDDQENVDARWRDVMRRWGLPTVPKIIKIRRWGKLAKVLEMIAGVMDYTEVFKNGKQVHTTKS